MKRNIPLILLFAVFLILILVYVYVMTPAQVAKAQTKTEYIVQNLRVEDIPSDDGTGLQIKWKPLSKDKKIIEYRIYRGISPDSMFFIGNIPVNPKTGVASDTMYYYDKGYTPFVDIDSPGKLKHERYQLPNSPLYRDMPRDMNITGQYLNHYIILGVIPTKEFYYHTFPLKRSEKSSDTGKMEDNTYAGLKVRQLRMLKELVPDHPYYYTVVAVDKGGHFYPYAKPACGVPRDNPPETPSDFASLLIQDAPRLQFEWDNPQDNSDIVKYAVYTMPESQLGAFADYRTYLRDADHYQIVGKEYLDQVKTAFEKIPAVGSDSTQKTMKVWRDQITSFSPETLSGEITKLVKSAKSDSSAVREAFTKAAFPPAWTMTPPAPVPNPAQEIAERAHTLPYVALNFLQIPLKAEGEGLRVTNPVKASDVQMDTTMVFSPAQWDQTYFVMGFMDARGQFSFCDPQKMREKAPGQYYSQSDLPILPPFNVSDLANDKGDCNVVSWGAPVAFLTKAAFLDETHTRLRINYQLEKNKNFKVSNIYFDIYDAQGRLLKHVNEFYMDNVIELKGTADLKSGLRIEMKLKARQVGGPQVKGLDFSTYKIVQELRYSDQTKALEPQQIMIGDRDVNRFSYVLLRQPMDATKFRFVRKLSGFQREMNDGTPYEASIFKQVSFCDPSRQMVMVTPDLSISYNQKLKGNTRTFVYRSEQDKFIADLKKNIDQYKHQIDSLGTDNPAAAPLAARLKSYQTQYDLMTKDSLLVATNKIQSDKSRIKAVAKEREKEKRSWRYILEATDGHGLFAISAPYSENGVQYFFPIANWFDKSKVAMLIASIIFALLVMIVIAMARRGSNLYIRPISGLQEIDNAIGRATEMGRPILYVPGLSSITDVATLAGLGILGKVAKKAAEYDTRILVPCRDLIVLPIAQEIVREAHYEAGRPDSYDPKSVFFITTQQFAFVAGVNGVMIREKTATNFYMGMFWAESLIMTETGSVTGAIQIAGTDAITQIPFFITTCDYTLIGEELYAASAYLSREPLMLGTLKAQDYYKLLILFFIIVGTALSTAHATFLINVFPDK